jgi:hypothetical protein
VRVGPVALWPWMRRLSDKTESGRLGRGLCMAVLLAYVIAGAANYWTLLRETRLAFSFFPRPYYSFMVVPVEGEKRGALGADFSQVYYAASALRAGDSAYQPLNPAFRDRFGRRPNYPPLVNALYVPLSFLPYRDALMVHVVGIQALLAGLTLLVLAKLGHRPRAPLAILTNLMLVALTAVGFAQLERGQFDLVVAASYLLMLGALYAGRAATGFAVAAACLGALKWTSAPFLLAFSLLALVASPSWRRKITFWIVPLVLVASALIFAGDLPAYWISLHHWEQEMKPTEISLEQFLPGIVVKGLPVLCTLGFALLCWLRGRLRGDGEKALQAAAVPFALGLGVMLLWVPRMAYEYRVASLLGLLPILMVWLDRGLVPLRLRQATALLFGLYCLFAFRVFDLLGIAVPSAQMLFYYVPTAFAFLGLAVHILWKWPATDSAAVEPLAPPAEEPASAV